MDNLYWLEQIQPADCSLVGNQALRLSQLMQRGYSVLPGFVISAPVWRQLFTDFESTATGADLLAAYLDLDVDDDRQLQHLAQALRSEIHNISPDWLDAIVEATADWDTLVFRLCFVSPPECDYPRSELWEAQVSMNTPDAIATTLLQTWGQLFRARSLFYWQRAEVDLRQIDVAVLVQPSYHAIAAGIINIQPNTAEIQAGFGSGEVQPVYIVDLVTGYVQSVLGNESIADGSDVDCNNLQAQQSDLQQLIALAIALASEFEALRVEWMRSQQEDRSELYITQISTTTLLTQTISTPQSLRGLAAAPGRLTAATYVVTDAQQKPTPPAGAILVAKAIAPDWLGLVQHVAAFVTEQGGLTSHSAILARELGVPAVVNVANATRLLQTGDLLTVDGSCGEIHLVSHQTSQSDRNFLAAPIDRIYIPHPAFVPIATQLYVNLSQRLLPQADLPVDGVGLLRSELMLVNVLEEQDLSVWLQHRRRELIERWCEQILQFARFFAPRPVFYRSLDWRSPHVQLIAKSASNSTISGFGRINSHLQNPMFEVELAVLAAVQHAGYDNVRLVLPFVRTVEEFAFCRRRVEQAGLFGQPQFQLWIMAEVPSVLFLIPEYVQAGVQGISIGTNDLTQLLLGVDRDLGALSTMFDARHPAVLRAIAQIIQHAKQAHIPCSICGQAPVLYPELIDSLVRWGITAISVEVEAVERTHRAIARAEQRLLVAAAQERSH